MESKKLKQTQRYVLRLFMMGSTEHIKRMLPKLRAAEIVELMAHLRKSDQIRFLQLLFDVRMAAPTLTELPAELAKELIGEFADDTIAEMVRRLSPDDAVDLLAYLPDERQEQVLKQLNEKERWTLERLRLYEDDTAGGRMTTEYIALSGEMTAEEALDALRQKYEKSDLLDIYVTDDHNHLAGILPLRGLVFASGQTRVKTLMVPDPVTIQPDTPQEEVANLVSDFDLLAVPVVDEENKILGVVTFDDVLEVMEEEATEDMYHLVGLDTAERVFSPVSRSVRLRVPWLLINLGTALLAALTVSLFKDSISKFVPLAVLMPIVAGLGGNAGSQSLTVVVRGLALGELEFASRWKAVLKEVSVGFCTGSLNGLVMGSITYLWYQNLWLSLILFVAMIANMILAGLFGALVPLLLKWANKDPALGSHIFVTTVTDVGGFFIFLGLATFFMDSLNLTL
ncbi:MAG: magnesium transporter [Thermodesulfobacteriota bacterium]